MYQFINIYYFLLTEPNLRETGTVDTGILSQCRGRAEPDRPCPGTGVPLNSRPLPSFCSLFALLRKEKKRGGLRIQCERYFGKIEYGYISPNKAIKYIY